MKSLKHRSVWIIGMALLIAACCPLLAFAAEEAAVPALYGTWWSLVPPVVAIALALITKEVYSSLFIGIVIGGILYSVGSTDYNMFEGTFRHVLYDGIIANLSDSNNVGILVFLVMLGVIVCLMNKSGGSAAFGRWAQKHIHTRIGAQLATIVLGVLIFVDDYFNCLTVGSVMRPITESHRVSKAKLAYLIDATAAPVCIIAPISSWAAAVSGFVGEGQGFKVFISAIPFNYYALLTIFFMIGITIMRIDYGPMKKHEENAILYNDIYTTPERPYADAEKELNEDEKGRVIDLVIPVIILIIFCIAGIMYSGGFFHGENGFVDSFANSDAAAGLSLGSILSLIVIVIYYMIRKTIKFTEAMDSIPEGFKAMIAAILILTLAWTIKTMTDSLGAADFVGELVKSGAEGFINFLPAIVFLVGCGLAFATGTSWGTFGVLIPIVMAVFEGYDPQMEIISISACMAGAVMGDHCSPISDTTIMSSAGAQCYHINHVNTQIPYAVTVAAVSFVCYIIAGFVKNAAVSLIIAFALMFVVLLILRKIFGAEQKA
ncbi:MAG: Na+/H+ antiporter NhaC family protein [Anaerovoracaceae bacterium]|nr:Na+/H+ antiporter NhaC family protein [Anaerovoracaceae bacterium]